MIAPVLQEKPEPDGEEARQPKVAVAAGLAEKDERLLIAILEGALGKNHAFAYYTGRKEDRVDPYGVTLFTFDPSSQTLSRVAYRTLEDAVNTEIRTPDQGTKDIRNLLSQGPDLNFLINSSGGNVRIYDLFERVAHLVTSRGGKVSSYGTAEISSVAALIFAEGKERHMLPYSRVLLHHPIVFSISLEDGTITKGNLAEEKRLIPKQREIISQIRDERLREAFLKQFDSGQDTVVPGFLLVQGNFATSYEDIQTMKKDFYRSIGVKPYWQGSVDLDGFWLQASGDYKEHTKQFEKFMTEGKKLCSRTDGSPTTPPSASVVPSTNEGNRTQHIYDARRQPRNIAHSRMRHVVSNISYAAVIALMVGTAYTTIRYLYAAIEREDRVMQPLVENLCSKYDWVSLQTGPQKVDWKREDGTVVEAEVGRNLFGAKLISVPSMGYNKDCFYKKR